MHSAAAATLLLLPRLKLRKHLVPLLLILLWLLLALLLRRQRLLQLQRHLVPRLLLLRLPLLLGGLRLPRLLVLLKRRPCGHGRWQRRPRLQAGPRDAGNAGCPRGPARLALLQWLLWLRRRALWLQRALVLHGETLQLGVRQRLREARQAAGVAVSRRRRQLLLQAAQAAWR